MAREKPYCNRLIEAINVKFLIVLVWFNLVNIHAKQESYVTMPASLVFNPQCRTFITNIILVGTLCCAAKIIGYYNL